MGHSSIQVTFDTYGHLFPNSRETAAKKLQQAMFTGRKKRSGSSFVAKTRKTREKDKVEERRRLIAMSLVLQPIERIGCGACYAAIHNALGSWMVRRWSLPKNGRRPTRSPKS
jgi:hypothetical protein